jgi:hypothetical protein
MDNLTIGNREVDSEGFAPKSPVIAAGNQTAPPFSTRFNSNAKQTILQPFKL